MEKQSYEFSFLADSNNGYVFQTLGKSIYLVEFNPSGYLIEKINESIAELVFEFSIILLEKGNSIKSTIDTQIGITIAKIVTDFFSRNQNNVLIYICDSKDNKQFARLKKFNQWFLMYQNESFVKFDEILVDSKNNRFPISMILRMDNPYRIEFIEAFFTMSKMKK